MRKRRPVSGAVLEFENNHWDEKGEPTFMLQSHFSTILLMRLGSTKRIEQCYNTRTLSFGCAANWVDYSKTGDKVTGDKLECVFAHLKMVNSRMNVKRFTRYPYGKSP